MRAAAIFSVGFIVGVALEWAFTLWQEYRFWNHK